MIDTYNVNIFIYKQMNSSCECMVILLAWNLSLAQEAHSKPSITVSGLVYLSKDAQSIYVELWSHTGAHTNNTNKITFKLKEPKNTIL